MGEVDTVAELRRQNPRATPAQLQIYADSLTDYRAAQANIAEYGTIVNHPRTGAPIPNPYLVIRDKAAAQILRLRLRADGLW